MTINSDRYLRLTGLSFLILLIWIGSMSMITIEFEFVGFFILITAIMLAVITFFGLLYIIELIDPHEEDVFVEKFTQFFTLKNIAIVVLLYALRKVYWFISEHINFQTNKHYGMQFLGGKRKGSTHHKKH